MKTIAQILNSKVHWVFESEDIPVFTPDIVLIDITSVRPTPQEGWEYDSFNDTFSPPIVVVIPPTPQITLEELSQNQLILMDVLATMYEDMLAKGTV